MDSNETANRPPAGDAEVQVRPAERGSRTSRAMRAAGAVLALLMIGGALLGLRGRGQHASTAAGATGPLDSRQPGLNQPAPDFALRDTQGRLTRLSDLRGQVVLVNFWATWCGPCRAELPDIEAVFREQQGHAFTAVEVNVQESPADVAAFARQIGELPPVLLDQSGAVRDQYRLKGLPDSFFIDRQGIVRALSYGPMSREVILKNIERARQATP